MRLARELDIPERPAPLAPDAEAGGFASNRAWAAAELGNLGRVNKALQAKLMEVGQEWGCVDMGACALRRVGSAWSRHTAARCPCRAHTRARRAAHHKHTWLVAARARTGPHPADHPSGCGVPPRGPDL